MDAVYVLHCKASDYDVATGTCAAPFYDLAPALLPRLSATEGATLSAAIVGVWAIGFFIKSARQIPENN
ncbi:MAG: hypothetical protein DI635_04095 [Pseudoxanthomonas suwonensis]|nr:MAG: hypothetical protein DI635_04095 [Pseudoxanthomonas suwonensis]